MCLCLVGLALLVLLSFLLLLPSFPRVRGVLSPGMMKAVAHASIGWIHRITWPGPHDPRHPCVHLPGLALLVFSPLPLPLACRYLLFWIILHSLAFSFAFSKIFGALSPHPFPLPSPLFGFLRSLLCFSLGALFSRGRGGCFFSLEAFFLRRTLSHK